ncbi:MAG: methyltransferase domain-containing protein [Bacteroidetes bacterium]|nr:methyltransferase domain-containing protein [Bacteroidota bacterium]MCW5894879.1 methyltransferase domain-containing protein [Bacteroidota bacterium]
MNPSSPHHPSLHEEVHPASSLPLQEDLRHKLSAKYDVVEKEYGIAGKSVTLLKVRDTNVLVDAIDPETFSEDERLPYWADVWTSSLELARWCLEDGVLRGKRVLELGCGLGLAGIAAAQAGAIVTFSDYETDALDFVRYNVQRNLPAHVVESSIDVIQFDWRRPPLLEPFDVVIAADVVYEQRMFAAIKHVLSLLLAPNGIAVMTEPGRSVGEMFFASLKDSEFRISTGMTSVESEGKTIAVVRAMIQRTHRE